MLEIIRSNVNRLSLLKVLRLACVIVWLGAAQKQKKPKPAAAKPQASYKIIENNPCKINSCPQIDGI